MWTKHRFVVLSRLVMGWMEGGTRSYFLVIQKQNRRWLLSKGWDRGPTWRMEGGVGGYSRGKHPTQQWTVAKQLLKQGWVTTGQLPGFPVTLNSVSKWWTGWRTHRHTKHTIWGSQILSKERRSASKQTLHGKAGQEVHSTLHKLFRSHTNLCVWLLKPGVHQKPGYFSTE